MLLHAERAKAKRTSAERASEGGSVVALVGGSGGPSGSDVLIVGGGRGERRGKSDSRGGGGLARPRTGRGLRRTAQEPVARYVPSWAIRSNELQERQLDSRGCVQRMGPARPVGKSQAQPFLWLGLARPGLRSRLRGWATLQILVLVDKGRYDVSYLRRILHSPAESDWGGDPTDAKARRRPEAIGFRGAWHALAAQRSSDAWQRQRCRHEEEGQ